MGYVDKYILATSVQQDESTGAILVALPAGTVVADISTADIAQLAAAIDVALRASALAVSGPLTDTQLRATAVPVSGTVTASGPLTDTQLRATAVPVSGAVTTDVDLDDVTGSGSDAKTLFDLHTAIEALLAAIEPPTHSAVVTPSDDADLAEDSRAISVAVAGNIKLTTTGGETLVQAFAAGQTSICVRKVFATGGTTATGISAQW